MRLPYSCETSLLWLIAHLMVHHHYCCIRHAACCRQPLQLDQPPTSIDNASGTRKFWTVRIMQVTDCMAWYGLINLLLQAVGSGTTLNKTA
jgi:hypothetical protein